jgi:hypothetical protein
VLVGKNKRLTAIENNIKIAAIIIVAFVRKSDARRTPNIVPTEPGAPSPPASPLPLAACAKTISESKIQSMIIRITKTVNM